MHDKYAKMKVFGQHSGGSKGWSKKVVSRYARRVSSKRAITESKNAGAARVQKG